MLKAGISLSHIPTLVTFEYPIRPIVFSNHCLWVEHVEKKQDEGFECALYYEPYTNHAYPQTVDAIFIEVLGAAAKGYLVFGFAIFPDADRREIRIDEWHTDFKKAKHAAIQWLLEARSLIVSCQKP